jgi:20S proteasome subunit beta 6
VRPYQIYFRNHTPAPGQPPFDPSTHPLSTVLSILVDSFSSATERHIEVGDFLEGYVILSPGRTSDDLIGEGVKGVLPEGMTVEEQDPEDLDVQSAVAGKGCRVFLVRKELKRD